MTKPRNETTFQAWRATIRARLLAARGMEPEVADLWCDAWEAEAARQGLADDADYWDAGKLWIDANCAARKKPAN